MVPSDEDSAINGLLSLWSAPPPSNSVPVFKKDPGGGGPDDMDVDLSLASKAVSSGESGLVFKSDPEKLQKLASELGSKPIELENDLEQALKQSAHELFKKFRQKEHRREILRYIHEICNPQDAKVQADAKEEFFLLCKTLEHEDFRRFKADTLRVNDKDEMIRLFEFESVLLTMLKLMNGTDWLSPISTGYGGGGRTGIIALVSPLEHAHREPSRHSGDWKRREYLVNRNFGEPGERVPRKRARPSTGGAAPRSSNANQEDGDDGINEDEDAPANISAYVTKPSASQTAKKSLASVMTVPLLQSTEAGEIFRFSEESKELFAALEKLETVGCVMALIGRSSTGKTLIAELLVGEYSKVWTSRLSVNPTCAAETMGIDAVLMTRHDGQGSMLILDTAGTDLAATELQSKITTFIALSVATSVVFFVDGELHNEEMRFLANSCRLQQDIFRSAPSLEPPIMPSPNTRGRLTVAYSYVSGARSFSSRETPLEHTRQRLTMRASPAVDSKSGARGNINKDCVTITAAYPLDQIGAVSIPIAEEALFGSAALYAAKVLERTAVAHTLKPVADALLSVPAGQPALTGTELVSQLRGALAAVTSLQVRALLDPVHITKLIDESREDAMAFLDDWAQGRRDFSEKEDDMLRFAVEGMLQQENAKYLNILPEELRAEVAAKLKAMNESVRAEADKIRALRKAARESADVDDITARLSLTAMCQNTAILAQLEADVTMRYQASRVNGPHEMVPGPGASKGKSAQLCWTCKHNCGLFQFSGAAPEGTCPQNVYYTALPWDAWREKAKADGSWKAELTRRRYDFAAEQGDQLSVSKIVEAAVSLEKSLIAAWEQKQTGVGSEKEDEKYCTQRLAAFRANLRKSVSGGRALSDPELDGMCKPVSAELAALRQRRTEARTHAEAEARMIHARAAATARNAAIVAELEAERRHVHASSITQGPHHSQYHVGSSNIFNRKRHHWTCTCGLYQYAGDRPGGSCPANRYHTQPTWEMWQAQAQADGSWRKVLEERGYDFSVDA